MREAIIGVDIGATKIASGFLDAETREVTRAHSLPTNACGKREEVLEQLFGSIEQLGGDWDKIQGIGVCTPGPTKDGVLVNPPNIPHWRNINLKEILADRYGKPVEVENDANAAGYAETIFGAARGYKHCIYVTVSTGVGTGIIIDGRVYRGKNGMAGEGGHVTIDYRDRPRGGAGVPGCIEGLASGTAIAARAQEMLKHGAYTRSILQDLTGGRDEEITAHVVAKAFERGDELAKIIIDEASLSLGAWLGSVVSLFDPEIVVLGGGVSRIGSPLIDNIAAHMPRYTINPYAREIPIVPAHLHRHVGIYGAASLVLSPAEV
jgi:glucokinase